MAGGFVGVLVFIKVAQEKNAAGKVFLGAICL